MDKIADNSNRNSNILLSRNTPAALVVGAASFFGSHLADQLLKKNLQVIGVDDLTFGKKNNLSQAAGNKNFHLIIESADKLNLDLDRLDYIFIIPDPKINLSKVMELFKEFNSRLLLISSINLYEKATEELKWLRKVESEIAGRAKENNLNARILRMGPLFGPRMSFNFEEDPLIRLVQQTLNGDLQKDISLEFSSRSLYIEDACDLAVKCIFAQSTAQKIFDGVLPTPIKVSDVKQVLLDPFWYESRSFTPTPLPPWPTPNLEKTIKFLNWQPKTELVTALRETIAYFKDNETEVPKEESWKEQKAEELEGLKKATPKKEEQKEKLKGKFNSLTTKFLSSLVALFIMYALVWPIFQISWGALTFKQQLTAAINHLQAGQFAESLAAVKQADEAVVQVKVIFNSVEPVRSMGLFQSQFDNGDSLTKLASLSVEAADNTILGIQALYQSLKAVTGEVSESAEESFSKGRTYLAAADEGISKAQALAQDQEFKNSLPKLVKDRVEGLSEKLSIYSNLVKKGRAISLLLPEAVKDGKKYLIILQDNRELRPTGGLITSVAEVSFEEGKLKKITTNDTGTVDEQLKIHVEPPKDIKSDLGQNNFLLKDANWEPDFPTSARQVEWFYNKETGERVAGVIALDISAVEDLFKAIGSLDVDAKDLLNSLLNKLFFLPNLNWPAIVSSLGKSLTQKHMSIYLDDQTLFSYLVSQKWASLMPRGSKDESSADFLAPVEANMGANNTNYYLDRSYNLETTIGKEGEISHRLRISYTNRNSAGKYKNRMRIYVPFGTKLTQVFWGEKDITKDASGLVDYNRTAFSFLIELLPKEQKILVVDYQPALKLEFNQRKGSYRLDLVKQAGTLQDPFEWRVSYPIDFKLASQQQAKIGPQQYSVKTDLSTDKTFRLEFIK